MLISSENLVRHNNFTINSYLSIDTQTEHYITVRTYLD